MCCMSQRMEKNEVNGKDRKSKLQMNTQRMPNKQSYLYGTWPKELHPIITEQRKARGRFKKDQDDPTVSQLDT